MEILFLMIAVSIIMATVFLLAFVWSVKSGQYDDNYTPSLRMLNEDKIEKTKNLESTNKNQSNGN